MKADSLDDLAAAFGQWRSNKRHVRERVPDDLWERALSATRIHGTGAVARATKLEHQRLVERAPKASTTPPVVPAFSRISLTAPLAGPCPIVEVETPTGLKLRFFAQTPETLNLLSSLCRGAS
jgi:hypothetical protein